MLLRLGLNLGKLLCCELHAFTVLVKTSSKSSNLQFHLKKNKHTPQVVLSSFCVLWELAAIFLGDFISTRNSSFRDFVSKLCKTFLAISHCCLMHGNWELEIMREVMH